MYSIVKNVSVVGKYDLAVIGGGPSGFVAALAAVTRNISQRAKAWNFCAAAW